MASSNRVFYPESSAGLVTEKELRDRFLKISVSTLSRVRKNISAGGDPDQLPPVIYVNQRRMYDEGQIVAWVARRSGARR